MDPNAATSPPDELTESLGKAFAVSLAKAEGQLPELQYLWEKIPDKSQEICIKASRINATLNQ